MIRAKEFGIDAFALNIGTDSFTDQQLGYAYASAANNGMKVFISFDFNWYQPTTAAQLVGAKIKQFASEPGQLMVDGKVFASSFLGDGLDVAAMREAAAPSEVFWGPNVHPSVGNFNEVDTALNWMVS
jgi:Glycosyl hydrolase family 71